MILETSLEIRVRNTIYLFIYLFIHDATMREADWTAACNLSFVGKAGQYAFSTMVGFFAYPGGFRM